MRIALAVLLTGAAGTLQAATLTLEGLADLLDPVEYRLVNQEQDRD